METSVQCNSSTKAYTSMISLDSNLDWFSYTTLSFAKPLTCAHKISNTITVVELVSFLPSFQPYFWSCFLAKSISLQWLVVRHSCADSASPSKQPCPLTSFLLTQHKMCRSHLQLFLLNQLPVRHAHSIECPHVTRFGDN